MTRKFYHGRTETMRPSTQEAVDWCKTMLDPKCDVSVLICGHPHKVVVLNWWAPAQKCVVDHTGGSLVFCLLVVGVSCSHFLTAGGANTPVT